MTENNEKIYASLGECKDFIIAEARFLTGKTGDSVSDLSLLIALEMMSLLFIEHLKAMLIVANTNNCKEISFLLYEFASAMKGNIEKIIESFPKEKEIERQ